MDPISRMADFKREHFGHYWTRLILFWAIVALAFTYLQSEDVEATTQDTYTPASAENPYSNYLYSTTGYLHAKDDHIVVAHNNDDGDLIVSYKYETEDEWNTTEIASYNWGGLTGPWRVYGVVGTSNGSISVCAGNYDGITYLDEVWLWNHFLGDPWAVWDDEKMIDSTTHYVGAVAINDTDQIMWAGRRGPSAPYGLYYQVFDFPNYEISDFISWQGKSWSASATLLNYIELTVNMSGEFHHVFEANDNIQYYVANSSIWTSKVQIASSSYDVRSAGFLENDMLVCAGQTGSTVPNYWYQTVYGGSFTKVIITTNSNTWSRGVALVLTANSNTTRVVSFNTDDGELFTWSAAWNGDGAAWQNSEANADRSDPDYIRMVGVNNARWPQDLDGREWAMPTGGWSVMAWDEDGATDDHAILWNSTTFWGNLTTEPPEITTETLPNAEFGVFYEHTLTRANGTIPHSWSILIGPAWLSIGSLNGTLYGTPDGTGTEQVRVNLDDAIPRDDERQWTLTIGPASEGEGDGGIWGDMWLSGEHCSSAGVVLLIIMFAIGVLGIVGSWKN